MKDRTPYRNVELRSAESQNCILQSLRQSRGATCFQDLAEYNSAIRQSATLRYEHRSLSIFRSLFFLCLLLIVPQLDAATNAGALPARLTARTNSLSSLPRAKPGTNAVATSKSGAGKAGKTNALSPPLTPLNKV